MGHPFGSTGSHRTGGMRTPALIFLIPLHHADDLAPCCTFPEKSGHEPRIPGKRSHQELKISKKVQQSYRAFVIKSGKIGELPGKSPARAENFQNYQSAIQQFRKKTFSVRFLAASVPVHIIPELFPARDNHVDLSLTRALKPMNKYKTNENNRSNYRI